MTIPKLFQWLAGIAVFMSVWLAFLTGMVPIQITPQWHGVIQVLPLYLLMAFACYSLGTVGYRVSTFNDCDDASEELKQQVEEAKEDLRKKGYKYASDWES